MGPVLPDVFPVLEAKVEAADEDVDLRETCLQGLESFVLKSPNAIGPYLGKCIAIGVDV